MDVLNSAPARVVIDRTDSGRPFLRAPNGGERTIDWCRGLRLLRLLTDRWERALEPVFAIVNHEGSALRVTGFTRQWFGGDPNYHCEPIEPAEVAAFCSINPRMRFL